MGKSKLFFIIAAVGLVVALGLMPRSKADEPTTEKAESVDQRIEEALKIVQSGQNPMAGIQILRDILEEDPDNLQATYALGVLSMQSGQFDKAVQRLTKVLEIDPHQHQALELRADAYLALGDTANTIKDFESLITHLDDPKQQARVNQILRELKD